MEKDTAEIAHEIKNAKSPEALLQDPENSLPPMTLAEYLTQLLDERKMTRSQMARAASIKDTYCCHLVDGRKKSTSRPKLLAIAVGLSLSEKETQRLLYYGGHPPLYPRADWDKIILYALQHHLSVIDTNIMLINLNLQPYLE